MLPSLLRKFDGYTNTCSIEDLEDKCVTFIRDEKYLTFLKDTQKDIWLIAPSKIRHKVRNFREAYCPHIKVMYSDFPEFEFTVFHNHLWERRRRSNPEIGKNCQIHSSCVIGEDGLKLVHGPNSERVQFIHSGHVLIGDNVYIGPNSVVHRGTLGITRIGENCKIGSLCNIGHNCNIGPNVVLASSVCLNGGVVIDHDSWIGSGSVIKHYVSICSDCVISGVVTKNIEKSGVYAGYPVKYIREIDNRFNF